jgi:hypothetical protein
MNVKWPVDNERRDTLSEMIVDCFEDFLSCKRLEDCLLRQDDERLTTTIVVIHRHAKSSWDMLKMLLNWESLLSRGSAGRRGRLRPQVRVCYA